MKHFIVPETKHVIALEEDGSQDFLIQSSWVQVSFEDAEAFKQAQLVLVVPEAKNE